LNFLCF